MQPEEEEEKKRALFNETMTSKTISQKSGWEKDWQKVKGQKRQ
jgi:hypothetical protein